MKIKKIRGVQVMAGTFDYQAKGLRKEVVYTTNFHEMTVDTDKGSWIITPEDLLSYLNNDRKV